MVLALKRNVQCTASTPFLRKLIIRSPRSMSIRLGLTDRRERQYQHWHLCSCSGYDYTFNWGRVEMRIYVETTLVGIEPHHIFCRLCNQNLESGACFMCKFSNLNISVDTDRKVEISETYQQNSGCLELQWREDIYDSMVHLNFTRWYTDMLHNSIAPEKFIFAHRQTDLRESLRRWWLLRTQHNFIPHSIPSHSPSTDTLPNLPLGNPCVRHQERNY